MKIQMSLVATAAAGQFGPKKGTGEMVKTTGPPMIHCAYQAGFDPMTNLTTISEITETSEPNHGLWGSVSLDSYLNDLHCYIDFAQQCDGQGVDIDFTAMAIETSSWSQDPSGSYISTPGCGYDQIKFMYTDANTGETTFTADDCGRLNGNSQWNPAMFMYDHPPKQPKLSLIGTDMKLIVTSDVSVSYGFAAFDWQCRSSGGGDICPSKFVAGNANSGCYTQSAPWHPGKSVSCSMENAACMATTCEAGSIYAHLRADLFHTNLKDSASFMQQLQSGTRALYREGDSTPLILNNPNGCGYTITSTGIEIEWDYSNPACPIAPTMNANGKIEYSIKISADGNKPNNEPMIEFYVDTDIAASCQYDPDVMIEADGFWVNQEDVAAEDSKIGSLANIFKGCKFFADAEAKNEINEHNIVNMGERIHGRVRTKNGKGYGLIYKLQRVTFIDASGTMNPPPKFHVIGGGPTSSGGKGSTIVAASVQKSKHIKNKPYWRPMSKNMKFSFLSFGFEHLANQNQVDVKCRIKIDIDPTMFPTPTSSGPTGLRSMGEDAEYSAEASEEWGALDYYDEDY